MNDEVEQQKTPAQLIREKLDLTSLSEKAKDELGKVAEDIFHKSVSSKIVRGHSKEQLIDVANVVACDTTFCAIPNQLPKTNTDLRKKVRKVTGIRPVIDPLARTDKTLKLLRNAFYEGKNFYNDENFYHEEGVPRFVIEGTDVGDVVEKKSRETVEDYLKKYSEMGGTVPSDSATTTGSAYYISSILVGYDLTQREVADTLGISEVTLRNRFKEMVEILGIEIPKRGYWKHNNK